MTKHKTNPDFINGVPEMAILKLLAEREMYGYEIVRGIRLVSNEQLQFGEGVIYPLLHSMQQRKLLAIRKTTFNSRPRIYYRLTAAGRKKLDQKIADWRRVTESVQALLEPVPDAPRTTR